MSHKCSVIIMGILLSSLSNVALTEVKLQKIDDVDFGQLLLSYKNLPITPKPIKRKICLNLPGVSFLKKYKLNGLIHSNQFSDDNFYYLQNQNGNKIRYTIEWTTTNAIRDQNGNQEGPVRRCMLERKPNLTFSIPGSSLTSLPPAGTYKDTITIKLKTRQ